MRTIVIGAFVFSALAIGCSTSQSAAVAPTLPSGVIARAFPLPESEQAPKVERRAGDFYVHMVSGSFRKQPALLTERVIAKEITNQGDVWIIEYKLEDSDGARTLRAWTDANEQVVKVSLMTDLGEMPGTIADYEALMAASSLAPDENEGLTASTKGTCTVGPSELDCVTKNYRVLVGSQEASLGITGSEAVPNLDLAGEITAADGTVIYRSVLIEHGNEASNASSDSLALAPSTP
jgi:hypothetical protein